MKQWKELHSLYLAENVVEVKQEEKKEAAKQEVKEMNGAAAGNSSGELETTEETVSSEEQLFTLGFCLIVVPLVDIFWHDYLNPISTLAVSQFRFMCCFAFGPYNSSLLVCLLLRGTG